MPLIQFLTLQGFAVFVPNAAAPGMADYTAHVDRDWGGKDRMDHVHAMTEVLPNDSTTASTAPARVWSGVPTGGI